ncbi:MAG: outer membrane lipoprotein carrier protein LolA [Smithella sp.]
MKINIKTNKKLFFFMAIAWAFLVLLEIVSVNNALAATSPSIDEVINRLQRTYENTKDFKAGFSQATTIRSIKKTDIEEGTVYLKKPKNMLWNYSKPKAKKLVINSRKAWLYLPQEKAAYVQEAENIFKSRTLIKFLSGLGKLKDDFSIKYAEPDSFDKQGNYLLILTPREKAPNLYPFRVTVDKNTSLILQVSFDDALGNSTVVKFSNIVTNAGLSEKMFQFKPPKGVSIFNMP